LLLEPRTQERLLAHSRGATVEHVNMKDIRALKVGAIPSVETQRSVVGRLTVARDDGDRLATIYQQKLDALDALKKSLLHDAFRGAL
jgi:type I restriction enzyme S subunit